MTSEMKYTGMSVKTFMMYSTLLTERIVSKITVRLPSKIAIMFDSWSHVRTYYVTVFFSYQTKDSNVYTCTLAAFLLLENEDNQSADEHVHLIEYGLTNYKKSRSRILSVIAGTCPANKAVARQLGYSFICFASQRFYHAVK